MMIGKPSRDKRCPRRRARVDSACQAFGGARLIVEISQKCIEDARWPFRDHPLEPHDVEKGYESLAGRRPRHFSARFLSNARAEQPAKPDCFKCVVRLLVSAQSS